MKEKQHKGIENEERRVGVLFEVIWSRRASLRR